MKVIFEILRRKNAEEKPYIQNFEYEYTDLQETVATALKTLNNSLSHAERIRWECSCMQKKCGACAMLIDGRPRLACDEKLADHGERIRLEPLKKFPPVADLVVDRQVVFDSLKELAVWFENTAEPSEKRADTVHEASRCLQCGCCLEVCPNFAANEKFKGMAAAVPLSRLIAEADEDEKKRIFKTYSKNFYAGCGKSLACRDICPAGIDTEELMVRSNAAAIWGKKRKK